MNAEQARQIIVDGVTEILGKPLVRLMCSADQIRVLKAVRDLATSDPGLAAAVAARTAVYSGVETEEG